MEPDGPLAFVDIDGVVADVRHRLHHVDARPKDWDAFFAAAPDDPTHVEGVALVERLAQEYEVVFLTGRPEKCRADTVEWLERHGLDGHRLVMRPRGDRRPAKDLKLQLLRELTRHRPVAVVVDDDPLVVETMKGAGYSTFHADWEARSAEDEAALRTAQEVEGQT
jgi:phosphoglycolate phosphatase-like HAD superfamily hydrolase